MRLACVLLAATALPAVSGVVLTSNAASVRIEIDGRPFTELFFGPETGKPYLHPLRSASGRIVTRLYPMEVVEGERHDHPHHQGLWFAHGDVNGFDFWSATAERRGGKFGRIALKRLVKLENGLQKGSLTAEFDWLAPDGEVLLTERRTMVFHSDPALRVIDFDILLQAVQQVRFGDTKEGTFAIRVAESMNETRGGRLVSADGRSGEKLVWGTRAPWMDYSGQVEGETVGIAIFDHPASFRHPTYWHVRGYGLFAANVFGERDFTRDKSRDGSAVLRPGETMRFRYRVVIHSGDAQAAGLAELYARYARE
jgi:hypothetical protein